MYMYVPYQLDALVFVVMCQQQSYAGILKIYQLHVCNL